MYNVELTNMERVILEDTLSQAIRKMERARDEQPNTEWSKAFETIIQINQRILDKVRSAGETT
jgi:hypothetical protein